MTVLHVVTVHPTVTIVTVDGRRAEIPTAWFPELPQPGQTWKLDLEQQLTDDDQRAKLNSLLGQS